jgi:hypothetical protein
MAQEAEEIVFPAKKLTGIAIAVISVWIGVLWILLLRQSNGLGRFSGGFMAVLIMATCLAVWASGRRRLVFAGKTLRVMAGSKMIEEIDLSRVTRLVLRRRRVGRGYFVSYFAVLPEREAELFAKQNYRHLPRIVQLMEGHSGRKIEEEGT